MSRVRARLNRAFTAEVQREPDFIAHMALLAEHTAKEVERIAPKRTTYYARHIEPYIRTQVTQVRNARIPAGFHVLSTDPFGHLVEAGSVNNPPYSPLRRGARAAGLRLVEDPHPSSPPQDTP